MNIVEALGVDPDFVMWQDLAKCRGMETDLFFDLAEEDPIVFDAAIKCCSLCPVRQQCEDTGIRDKECGIWGGNLLDRGLIIDYEV